MKNYFNMLFFYILLLSSLISISSNSWLSIWMGLEINLVSFIPLMMNKNLNSLEAMIIYFLFQALASSMIFMIMFSNYIFMNNLEYIFFLPMIMKLGCVPFHFWFPLVMQNLSWKICSILMIWQKLTPMIILSYLNIYYLTIFIILSTMISAIKGFNQTSMRKILTFSSINHMSWMFITITFNMMIWKIYFIIYSFINISIIMFFYNYNINNINQMFFFNNSILKNFMFLINLFSLGGLPPFLGFFPKFLILLNMWNNFMLLMILMLFSLIILFFYLRIFYNIMLFNYSKMKLFNKKKNILLIIMTFINLLLFNLMFLILNFICLLF